MTASATLRIAEVADQAGITTATVRYYERIGVLPPSARAGNGYRVYDQRTVERLRFVGRAKQLGCNLEEIADLVTAWDGGECGPVQDRLKELVTAKLDAARAEIVELVTFTADLQRAAASLHGHRPPGPCDDHCGCVADPAAAPAQLGADADLDEPAPSPVTTSFPVALTTKPDATAGPAPLACTLDAARVPGRIDDWAALTAAAVARTPIPGGVRLDLGDGADVATAARLAAAEQDCCRFFAFRLTIDSRGVGLEVTAPDAALDVVHAMVGAPA